jgi:DNA-binding NarL/FixJ family response regulator
VHPGIVVTPAPTLLLVDDHRMLRESLRRSLEASGLSVVAEAADGEEAVRLAVALEPAVALMDVSMPGMDGVEAARLIRAGAPRTRVVMLTMHADDEVLARALRAGADGYLVKDCSIEEVVATVTAVAAGETTVSAGLAASMLDEVRRLAVPAATELVTRREEEVLQLIADGYATSEVAERLYISQKTVKNHLASIYQKLDARDRTQAVLRAVRMGIIRLD